VSVTLLTALVAFTTTLPKLTEVLGSVVGVIPTARSDTFCGLFDALVVMVKTPDSTPVALGVTVKARVQVAPAPNVPGFKHVVDGSSANGLPAGRVSEAILRATAWLFVSVTLLIPLVAFTTTLPKLTEVTESLVCANAKAVENRQNIAVSETRTAL